MMHGRGKSDEAIVAVKPANKAEQSAAERVERRAEAKGNARQQSTHRTQSRGSVTPALERIRQAAKKKPALRRYPPEVGAVCGKAARTVLCGGRSAMSVPTATHGELNDGVCRMPDEIASHSDGAERSSGLTRGSGCSQ
jgi:hypothetical protein